MKRTTKHIDWTELQRLVKAMKEDGDRYHLLIVLQSLTGLRIGDVLRITWRDILSNTELSVKEQKTGKTKRIAISDALRDAVQEEYDRFSYRIDSEPIFMNKRRTKAVSVSYVNRKLKSSFKKHNVEAEQVSSHVFRKTFSYKILEDNNFSHEAIFKVSRLLNHANINTTMIYLNLHEREADNIYRGLKI
jgi:integrase